MSAKRNKEASEVPSGNPNNIKLESVNPLWLDVSPQDRCYQGLGLACAGGPVAPGVLWRRMLLQWLYTQRIVGAPALSLGVFRRLPQSPVDCCVWAHLGLELGSPAAHKLASMQQPAHARWIGRATHPPGKQAPIAGVQSNVQTPFALGSCSCRYLLLEDPDTGDVLMPLIYMKAVLEANYSRKLASLKNRLVTGREGVSWLGWGSGRGGSD